MIDARHDARERRVELVGNHPEKLVLHAIQARLLLVRLLHEGEVLLEFCLGEGKAVAAFLQKPVRAEQFLALPLELVEEPNLLDDVPHLPADALEEAELLRAVIVRDAVDEMDEA